MEIDFQCNQDLYHCVNVQVATSVCYPVSMMCSKQNKIKCHCEWKLTTSLRFPLSSLSMQSVQRFSMYGALFGQKSCAK